MQKEAFNIKERPANVPPGRVTLAEIEAVKRDFIERNLSLSFDEVAAIFGKSTRWVRGKVRDGVFLALDADAKPGENGLQASCGIRITARSVSLYRESITISPERWAE